MESYGEVRHWQFWPIRACENSQAVGKYWHLDCTWSPLLVKVYHGKVKTVDMADVMAAPELDRIQCYDSRGLPQASNCSWTHVCK